MSKQRYYTNGALYESGHIKDARNTLGPVLYKKYGNFGPSLTDRHVVSYPLVESFTIGNWVYEVYEYECMNLSFRGYVSENHIERAVRFYPLLKD
jgi:hypothetical protein